MKCPWLCWLQLVPTLVAALAVAVLLLAQYRLIPEPVAATFGPTVHPTHTQDSSVAPSQCLPLVRRHAVDGILAWHKLDDVVGVLIAALKSPGWNSSSVTGMEFDLPWCIGCVRRLTKPILCFGNPRHDGDKVDQYTGQKMQIYTFVNLHTREQADREMFDEGDAESMRRAILRGAGRPTSSGLGVP